MRPWRPIEPDRQAPLQPAFAPDAAGLPAALRLDLRPCWHACRVAPTQGFPDFDRSAAGALAGVAGRGCGAAPRSGRSCRGS